MPVNYKGFRISEIWAWTQIGTDDEEGIIAFWQGDTWVPLIAADQVRLEQMRPYAERIAVETGRPVLLSRFAARQDLETMLR